MTWSSNDEKIAYPHWKLDKTNWESCFTWPFVLYRFHCDHCRTVLAAVWNHHPRSLRRFVNISHFYLYFFCFCFTIYSICSLFWLFFGSFSYARWINLSRLVRITYKPIAKSEKSNTKQKLSVESKCTLMCLYTGHIFVNHFNFVFSFSCFFIFGNKNLCTKKKIKKWIRINEHEKKKKMALYRAAFSL